MFIKSQYFSANVNVVKKTDSVGIIILKSIDYRLLEKVLETPEVCRPRFESYCFKLLVNYILANTWYILVSALYVICPDCRAERNRGKFTDLLRIP